VPVGVVLYLSSQGFARFVAGACVFFSVGAILFTYSRGAEVAFVLGFAMLIMLGHVRLRYGVLLAAVIVGVILAVPTYRDRVASLGSVSSSAGASEGQSDTTDTSVASRATEMEAALLVWANHPILGVGPEQFPQYYQRYAVQVGGIVHQTVKYGPDKGQLDQRVTHNILLGIAANMGIVGEAVFLTIVLVLTRALWVGRTRARRAGYPTRAALADAYLVSLALYLAAGMFLELAYERYFWMIVALGWCAAQYAVTPSDEMPAAPPDDWR
jgi:O-antigen ligase